MYIRHQQFSPPNEFAVLLPFDGTHGNLTSFLHAEAVGLPCVHLGMGSAIAMQSTLADLRVDAPRDEEGDVDVVVLQLQRFVEAEQGMLSGAIGRAQREAEQAR